MPSYELSPIKRLMRCVKAMVSICALLFLCMCLPACATEQSDEVTTSEAKETCMPAYEQTYQPPLTAGESGRVISFKTGEYCERASKKNALLKAPGDLEFCKIRLGNLSRFPKSLNENLGVGELQATIKCDAPFDSLKYRKILIETLPNNAHVKLVTGSGEIEEECFSPCVILIESELNKYLNVKTADHKLQKVPLATYSSPRIGTHIFVDLLDRNNLTYFTYPSQDAEQKIRIRPGKVVTKNIVVYGGVYDANPRNSLPCKAIHERSSTGYTTYLSFLDCEDFETKKAALQILLGSRVIYKQRDGEIVAVKNIITNL